MPELIASVALWLISSDSSGTCASLTDPKRIYSALLASAGRHDDDDDAAAAAATLLPGTR